jgi:hypothetical protein
MRAVAVAALGKMVGHSLNGKLVVIMWNQRPYGMGGHESIGVGFPIRAPSY